jgi:hypothetical protein
MAEQAYRANWNAEAPKFGMPALWRLAMWGTLATFALFAAVISAYSNAASQRPTASVTSGQRLSGQATSSQGTVQQRTSGDFEARPGETAEETRRLAEAVRALAADRDQVLARIAALERNLDGVTGSIKRERIAGPQPTLQQGQLGAITAAPAARPESPSAPMTEAAITPAQPPASQQSAASDAAQLAAPDTGNRASPPSNLVRAATPGEPVAAPAEPLAAVGGLGVDVGSALNYEGLRTLWHSTKNSDPALLEELYPVVTVRENSKTHGVDLRLVVGPIADAEAAARLCKTLSAAHHYCQPVAFDGQRLSLNDAAPTKPAAAPSHHAAPNSSASKFEPETPHFRAVIGK